MNAHTQATITPARPRVSFAESARESNDAMHSHQGTVGKHGKMPQGMHPKARAAHSAAMVRDAASIAKRIATGRKKFMAHIGPNGSTVEQITIAANMNINAARKRCLELHKLGLLTRETVALRPGVMGYLYRAVKP